MDDSRDFVKVLGQELSLTILMYLNDPSDLVRTSAVSRYWREFVIANGLSKKLSLRTFPEASSFARVLETRESVEPMGTRPKDSAEWACLEREHRVYASLSRDLMTSARENCISDAICASSTDNYPDESINNTLKPSDRIGHRASYWSSKGANDPSTPDRVFDLCTASRLCVITEFHVHPFQAYFQFGFPIYSAKDVRFHMGYLKAPLELDDEESDEFIDDKDFCDDHFVWTYSSPEFPKAREIFLQKFKLPEPILCVGGILKVELLGRVQIQEMDGLYYICCKIPTADPSFSSNGLVLRECFEGRGCVTIGGETFEAGGSILHPKNYHVSNYTKLLSLKANKHDLADDSLSNSKFVYKTLSSNSNLPIVQRLISIANSIIMALRCGVVLIFRMNSFIELIKSYVADQESSWVAL